MWAVAVLAAAITMMIMGVLMTIALACVYQGAHAARTEARRARQECLRYHRKKARHSGRYRVRAAASGAREAAHA